MLWFTWRSIVEILLFSAVFYIVARWLRTDARLLRFFVAYGSVLCVAVWCELPTVVHVLTLFAPAVVMLWVVVHQDTLAKRFVTVRNITPVQPTSDWLAVLFGSLLNSVQKNRPAFVVIEKQDSLKSLLASSCSVHTEIQKNLLELLLSSTLYESNKLIWVTHRGQLLAINAYWHAAVEDRWISEEVLELDVWKQDALLLSHKTDAVVLYIKPETRTVTIICQQKIVEDISVAQALLTVKTYLFSQNSSVEQHNFANTKSHSSHKQVER